MQQIEHTGRSACAALLALALAACGGGWTADVDGSGSLRLALTDAPACGFDAVNVSIAKVRVHQSGAAGDTGAGWSEVVLNPVKRVDLLTLTNGVLTELGQISLPAGKYTQLRLVLAENSPAMAFANSVKPTGGVETALTTPSGQQSGLKTNINIDVAANQLADVVLDFDACKSIVTAGNSGRYLLKPVLQVIPRVVTGLSGRVDASIANGSTTLALQDGTGTVRATVPDAAGNFLLQPVPAGSYSLVLTAPGRTTLVVKAVVLAGGVVNTLGSANPVLNPPLSPTGTLSGTVATGGASIDAAVSASQALTGGPTVELIARPVDSVSGLYRYQLPTAAPQVATYAGSTAALAFSPDATAAGRYGLQASAGSTAKTAGPLTLESGSTVATAFTFP